MKKGFTSYKGVDATWFSFKRAKAKQRGKSFSVTRQEVEEILRSQKYRCSLTGVGLYSSFYRREHKNRSRASGTKLNKVFSCTASMDRIDSSVGYEPGNVRWVHKEINRMKGSLSDREFKKWCKRVVEYEK